MNRFIFASVVAATVAIAVTSNARADVFKSANECVVGKRVADGQNKTGVITHKEGNGGTMCTVKLDDGSEHYYIFWMLRNAGASSETNDKLVPGTYQCFAGGRYTFMDMNITGPNTYVSAGTNGRFHVEPSRKIVFESGPLSRNFGHLLPGPAIGLNTDGGSFYGTTCELKK